MCYKLNDVLEKPSVINHYLTRKTEPSNFVGFMHERNYGFSVFTPDIKSSINSLCWHA